VIYLGAKVTKALAGTDAGTITGAIGQNGVFTAITNGVITIPLSTAIDTRVEVLPTAAHRVTAGHEIRFTAAKTTAGGKAVLSVYFERRA